jgi:hypothetical protein
MSICQGNSADGLMEVFYCYSCLFQLLDEVQSYILVERSIEHNSAAADSMAPEFIHFVSSSNPLGIPLYNIVVVSRFIVYAMVICCAISFQRIWLV